LSIASLKGSGHTLRATATHAVKFLIFISLPFLLLSCANLAADRWDEEEEEGLATPSNKAKSSTGLPAEELSAEELPGEENGDGLQLVDPDTTSELMKDENKKTVSGPTPVKITDPKSDSAIDIKPSSPTSVEE